MRKISYSAPWKSLGSRTAHRHEALSREFYCQFDGLGLGLDAFTETLGRGATYSGGFHNQAVRVSTHLLQEDS